MKIAKYSLLTSLFFSACVPNQAIESQNNVSKETSSEVNTQSEQNQANSSSSGGSSGGSSSGGGSSSSGKTSSPSPVSWQPLKTSRYNFNQTSFASNTLTTPLFKIEYDDEGVSNKRVADEKENFLKRMYERFLNMTIFGNEVYTISTIIFKEVGDLSVERQWGRYWPTTQKIRVLFERTTNEEVTFSIFNHEYYHHLTFLRMEKVMQERFNQQIEKNESDFNTYEKYRELLNDGKRQFEQNWIKNYVNYPYLQAWTFEHERLQYYNNHFTDNTRNSFVTFARRYVNKSVGAPNYNYYSYWGNFDEFLASSMNLYTILLSGRSGNLVELNDTTWGDYLLNLFIRTNIYYEYTNDLRKYPTLSGSGRNRWVNEADQLDWEEVKDFNEATPTQMNEKWSKWKKYFTEVLFNNDELLSDAFMEQENDLYLELNIDNATISFENIAPSGGVVTPTTTKLQSPTQITFNLKPYQEQAKSFVNSFAYKIKDNALAVGTYKIKINNQYLSEEQGLNLKNRTLKYKNIWSKDEDRSIPVIKEYKFHLQDNHIVLEVCGVSGCSEDS